MHAGEGQRVCWGGLSSTLQLQVLAQTLNTEVLMVVLVQSLLLPMFCSSLQSCFHIKRCPTTNVAVLSSMK